MKRMLNLNNGRRTLCACSIAAAFLAAAPANAAIVGMAGDATGPWYGPPASLRLNDFENNTQTQVWVEQQGMLLPSSVYYNAHNPGTYQQNSALVHQTIPGAGSMFVNSYIFHFDPTSGIRSSTGSVDFDHDIYVISENNDLDSSDVWFGMPGVQYATGLLSDRGYDLASNDAFWISNPSAGVWRLTFEAHASTGMDELRVIETPEPASLTMLALAGLHVLRRRSTA